MREEKVLIIAPHMDDEVLGCAGAILKHKDNHDNVALIFVAHRIYEHKYDKVASTIEKTHALKAKRILGYDEEVFLDLKDERLDASIQDIVIPIEKHIKKIRPSLVYLPFRNDNNQDHRAVFDACRVVFRPIAVPFVKKIFMYEVPSSTDQSPPLSENAFLPNFYIDITKYINKKIKAYRCYKTEKRDYPHPRSEEALKVLAKKRGTEIGFEFAEAFTVLRERWC